MSRLNNKQGDTPMLFCITADYTPQALNAMRENPTTNRREAVEQLVQAAGGKVIAMYGTMRNGPGAMLIFDVTDPASAPPIAGIIASSGAVQNLQFSRLATMEEVTGYRQKAQQLRGAYKAPGS